MGIAFRTLGQHKLSAALALLGIALGVAVVIAMVAVGKGAEGEVLQSLQAFGSDLLIVEAGQVKKVAGRPRVVGQVTTLTVKDARALEAAASVALVVPLQQRDHLVKYGDQVTPAFIVGTTPLFPEANRFLLREGRFFTEEERAGVQRVAVLGHQVAEKLFGRHPSLEERVRIGKVSFQVIGVMEQRGGLQGGAHEDNQVFIPIETALRRLFRLTHLSALLVRVKEGCTPEEASREITGILRERHRLRPASPDDFLIRNPTEVLEAEMETRRNLTFLLGGIALLSLLVGGFGILAVMLISVKERTREIGIRRAVGARRRDILLQFVTEALALCLGGEGFGVLVGIGAAEVIALSTDWPVRLSWQAILVALAFATTVGLFFSLYPARQASLLSPIEALRYE